MSPLNIPFSVGIAAWCVPSLCRFNFTDIFIISFWKRGVHLNYRVQLLTDNRLQRYTFLKTNKQNRTNCSASSVSHFKLFISFLVNSLGENLSCIYIGEYDKCIHSYTKWRSNPRIQFSSYRAEYIQPTRTIIVQWNKSIITHLHANSPEIFVCIKWVYEHC
jgi:hypothetical protein